jgi:Putative prokaryotic signal transducing protein
MPLVLGGELSEEPAASEAHERARKIRPEYTRGELVRVAGARHQAEAEFIQNLLLEEGIPSISRRSAGFDVPDFLAAGWRDVLVPESGAEAAREVLTEAEIEPALPRQAPARVSRLVLWIVVGLLIGAALLWLALGSPR